MGRRSRNAPCDSRGAVPRPPLDLIALYEYDVPRVLDLDVAGAPPFRARRLAPPFEALTAQISEAGHPMSAWERAAANGARAALQLRCDADVPPASRLPGCVELMRRCCDAGAVAVALPAACKIVGASELAALGSRLDTVDGWLDLFVHLFVVRDDEFAWSHTHGMEHFGLPDLECRTLVAEVGRAERLLEAGVRHLLDGTDGPFEPGDLVEATEQDGRPIARAWVYPPRDVEDHGYGAYGALQLVPDPR